MMVFIDHCKLLGGFQNYNSNKLRLIFLLTYLMASGVSNAIAEQDMVTINGDWSPWSTVATPCVREINGAMVNVSCGGGNMIRRRSCTNPEPQVGHPH